MRTKLKDNPACQDRDQFSLRVAQLRDLDQLLFIEDQCFSSDRINGRQMRYLLNRAKALMLVSVDTSDRAVGYGLIFTPQLQRPARLYSLAVSLECRGHGLGQKLLAELLRIVRQKGFRSCVLEVRNSDTHTQLLYQRCDFKPIKLLPAYYADGEDGLRMKLSLNPLLSDDDLRGELCHPMQ